MRKEKNKNYKIRVSENLRFLSKQSPLAEATIAKKLSINKSTFHNWINGSLPKGFMSLLRIADYFEVSLDQLCYSDLSLLQPDYNESEVKWVVTIKKSEEDPVPKLHVEKSPFSV